MAFDSNFSGAGQFVAPKGQVIGGAIHTHKVDIWISMSNELVDRKDIPFRFCEGLQHSVESNTNKYHGSTGILY